MKIGVDLSFIRPDHTNGGTEACIINLIKGFINIRKISEFIFFIHEDIYKEYKERFPQAKFFVYSIKGNHKVRTLLFQTFYLKKLIKKMRIEVIYFPTYTTGLRNHYGVPIVVNPHDVQFKFYPEYFSKIKLFYLDRLYRNSLKKADKIVGISHYVENTLKNFYPKECGNKIEVLYDPVDFDDDDITPYKNIDGKFILSVNSIQKHKNIITLVKAYDLIKDEIDVKLVLAGSQGNGENEISQYIKEHDMEDKVIFTGRISNGEIKWLYHHAEIFVTPSMYEGFGMTPVEAMARGCKTISTKETSLFEATMGQAIYYEPANDPMQLYNALKHSILNKEEIVDKFLILKKYKFSYVSEKYYLLFKKNIGTR